MGGYFSGAIRWLWGRFGGTQAQAGGGVCATLAVTPSVVATVSVAPSVVATVSVEAC